MIFENSTNKVLDAINDFTPKKKAFILKVLSSHKNDVSQITTYDKHFMIIFKFTKDDDDGLSYIMSKDKEELINFIRKEFHNFHSGTKQEKEKLITDLINYNLTIVK